MASKAHPDLQQKQLTKAINKVIKDDFKVNTTDDESILENSNFSWDDLTKLKEELGNHILDFVAQVNSTVTNQAVINSLKDQLPYFNKLVMVFFSDINDFSGKVKTLREQHEGKTGPINNITEFDTYNRIAIMYQSYFTELTALVAPTLSDLVLVIAEAAQSSKESQITDVVPKEPTNV